MSKMNYRKISSFSKNSADQSVDLKVSTNFVLSLILKDEDYPLKVSVNVEITGSERSPLSDSGGFRGWMLRLIPRLARQHRARH